MTSHITARTATLVVALVLAAAFAPVSVSAAGTTDVSLSPSSGETTVGGTTTYDVVVENADGGVGAYTATVAVDDPSVATITDVSVHPSAASATTDVAYAADNSSATINAALMDTADTGAVTIATVTVAGESPGNTGLSLSVDALGDENAVAYDVTATAGASLTVGDAAEGTTPTLVVESETITNGQTTSLGLTLSNAPAGLAGYEISVHVEDTDVASISGAMYPSSLGLTASPVVTQDGSHVTLRATDIDDNFGPGASDVPLATVFTPSNGVGTTNVTVDFVAMDDDAGDPIAVTTTTGTLTVEPLLPPVGDNPAPTDPDGDGVYEDVNGNGELDYNDVVTLFDHMNEAAVLDNAVYYDFNGNGRIDYDDVVTLNDEVTG